MVVDASRPISPRLFPDSVVLPLHSLVYLRVHSNNTRILFAAFLCWVSIVPITHDLG